MRENGQTLPGISNPIDEELLTNASSSIHNPYNSSTPLDGGRETASVIHPRTRSGISVRRLAQGFSVSGPAPRALSVYPQLFFFFAFSEDAQLPFGSSTFQVVSRHCRKASTPIPTPLSSAPTCRRTWVFLAIGRQGKTSALKMVRNCAPVSCT